MQNCDLAFKDYQFSYHYSEPATTSSELMALGPTPLFYSIWFYAILCYAIRYSLCSTTTSSALYGIMVLVVVYAMPPLLMVVLDGSILCYARWLYMVLFYYG